MENSYVPFQPSALIPPFESDEIPVQETQNAAKSASTKDRENIEAVKNQDEETDDVFDADDLFSSPRLFAEMSTLSEKDVSDITWKEAARWVRFEEDVEEEGQRWSKPRVSTLSLQAFFELRTFLVNGTIALNVGANNIEDIFRTGIANASVIGRPTPEELMKIIGTLKRNCVHLFEINKKGDVRKKEENSEKISIEAPPSALRTNFVAGFKGNKAFMRKLADGTEAANILIGEVRYLKKHICLLVRLKHTAHLGQLTEVHVPTRFVFLLLGPMGELERLTEVGRSIATLLSDEVFREIAYKGRTKAHILAGMDEFLRASTLLPPGEWNPDIKIEPPLTAPTKEMRMKKIIISEEEEEEELRRYREASGLTRTGRLFGGLVNDIKRKYPHYVSDFKDAFSLQSVATVSFLYFACLAPIVTFGGLLGKATGNNLSVMESLVSGLICGVLYGFFAGQPLTIIGSTGPVLVFETILYRFCVTYQWHYLSFRFWIGMWAVLYLFVMVAMDLSALVCYITRFTEENFACLIALIFIVKAIENVAEIGHHFPMHTNILYDDKLCECSFGSFNETLVTKSTYIDCLESNGTMVVEACDGEKHYPDIFLLCILECFATFFLATFLKGFKTTTYFPLKVRTLISDFAVISAIAIMASIDYSIGIMTPKLEVPLQLVPTIEDRGWVTYPFNGNPWWTCLVAAVPALLACILIFMDQQITSVIINRKELKLKKGGGFHLDLLVLTALIAINSFLGLPWFVAATVLSINHVNSLKLESACAAPGEKPQFFGIRENRLTNILIFVLIGLSVKMSPLLQKIPMAVLYGVFLYMGTTALAGIQFYDRILLMFMPGKYQPDHTFLRKVPLKRVHIYTAVQLGCFAMLMTIKNIFQISILFPLMLVVMVGIRKVLDYFFTKQELIVLDDPLPEFVRKEKLDEEEEMNKSEFEDSQSEVRRKSRILSISITDQSIMLNTASAKIFTDNIEEANEWDGDEYSKSMMNLRRASRRGSEVLKQIRMDSILGPVFAHHSYEEEKCSDEEEEETCFKSKCADKKDALTDDEVQELNVQESSEKDNRDDI